MGKVVKMYANCGLGNSYDCLRDVLLHSSATEGITLCLAIHHTMETIIKSNRATDAFYLTNMEKLANAIGGAYSSMQEMSLPLSVRNEVDNNDSNGKCSKSNRIKSKNTKIAEI